jgi:hypothetical protein
MSRVPPVGVASPTGDIKKRQDRGIFRVFATLQTCVYTVAKEGNFLITHPLQTLPLPVAPSFLAVALAHIASDTTLGSFDKVTDFGD